ncbi:neural cell adhesion molecule 2-like isoform X4 [Pristis pectinata]|uniref:neural cell adhesion molecule 2-like isoform X4 n=1 Tax=Pristis pectinata TaxID=685728 RepID=UPI00223E40F4|nr:neural cell adhesion molecule 2-like isoform X4 [Pristis pectinata]
MWEFCVRRVLHLLSASLFTSCVAGTGAPPPTVNGARGHSVSFPPGIPVGPDVAEVEWSRTSPRTRIVKYSKGHIEYFGSEEYKRQVTLHPGDFSLEIRDLRREDAGEYEVNVAASSGAETLGTVRLEVYEPVSGTHITVQNITGTCNLTLTCSLTSGDPTSFRWWRGREAVGNDTTHHLWEHGETVEIHHTAEVEDVVYRCEARNPVSEGTAQIRLWDVCKLHTPAATEIPSHTVNGTLRRAVSLPGIAAGPSVAMVVWSWISNGTRIAEYSKGHITYFGSEEYKRRVTLHPENFRLEIRDLRREDAGDYEVTVTAGSGAEKKMRIRLEVSAAEPGLAWWAILLILMAVGIIFAVLVLCWKRWRRTTQQKL